MLKTTVVFVHGFVSSPACWDPFFKVLVNDHELRNKGYSFTRFQYATEFLQWNPTKRIPSIHDCGSGLGVFIDTECRGYDQLILVGHSMGGLVIQDLLAQKIQKQRGKDLAKIRSVVLFATPNRGSTILSSLRGIFDIFRSNPQEHDLEVLNRDIAETSDIIVRSVLAAKRVGEDSCPIPFRVFWGAEDIVVPEVSARGSFVEASCLPGSHSGIIQCDPKDPRDQRYLALKDALLNPIGHPSIYEVDLFEVTLAVSPVSPETTFMLRDLEEPLEIHTDNVALRMVRIAFSKQNRCRMQYEQTYRSEKGYVELLGLTEPNEALPETMSEYFSTGRRFTYLFTPDRDDTYVMKVCIRNGYCEGERSWHNHMKANARYKSFRFTLNLKDYEKAGVAMTSEPSLYFHTQNIMDHKLCSNRILESPLPCVPSADPWLRSWEIADVMGGVVDIAWDFKKSV
jgi:pimeloyl-ACP methyl ester carboxylesterase